MSLLMYVRFRASTSIFLCLHIISCFANATGSLCDPTYVCVFMCAKQVAKHVNLSPNSTHFWFGQSDKYSQFACQRPSQCKSRVLSNFGISTSNLSIHFSRILEFRILKQLFILGENTRCRREGHCCKHVFCYYYFLTKLRQRRNRDGHIVPFSSSKRIELDFLENQQSRS